MTLGGGCQCGAVRYEVSAKPLEVYVCHCRECRKQSASAFGISVVVPAHAFVLKQGHLKSWTRPTDSGGILECLFCVECGSRIRHSNPRADTVSIKGGSLDEPVDLTDAVHIWTTRKLPGIAIPEGAAQFPGEPDEQRNRPEAATVTRQAPRAVSRGDQPRVASVSSSVGNRPVAFFE